MAKGESSGFFSGAADITRSGRSRRPGFLPFFDPPFLCVVFLMSDLNAIVAMSICGVTRNLRNLLSLKTQSSFSA